MIEHRNADGTIQAKHGLSTHPLYNVFKSMHDRCENSECKAFERYGGRGITVCDEWSIDHIDDFVSWALANGWKRGLEIDRIDNDKGYSPDNCRIVTAKENGRNKRSNKCVEINGEKMLLCEAVERFSVVTKKQFELRYYHQRWSLEKALFQPLQVHHKLGKE